MAQDQMQPPVSQTAGLAPKVLFRLAPWPPHLRRGEEVVSGGYPQTPGGNSRFLHLPDFWNNARTAQRGLTIPYWKAVECLSGRTKDLLVALAYALLTLALARNVLAQGFPPGVDTPTFLHMSWFTSETLHGRGGYTDPYWYGGFPVFTTYPPLSYGVVGLLDAIPGIGLVFVFKAALLAAYAGVGCAAYFLARQLGNSRPWSALGGALALTAYPLLAAGGLWGWSPTIWALAFALLSLGLLERAYQRDSRRLAIYGGLAMGAAFLSHHMTAGGMALGLPFWFLYVLLADKEERPRLVRVSIAFTTAAVLSVAWWVVPWLYNLAQADFHREAPGLWSFAPLTYVQRLADRSMMGQYTYPNYIGAGLTVLAIGGILHAFVAQTRALPYAALLLLLLAVSLGAQANPLIRIGPLTGLDVARFQLYMAPVIAVVGLPFLSSLGVAIAQLVGQGRAFRWLPAVGGVLAVALLVGQTAWDSAGASAKLFHTYRISPEAQEMVRWLGEPGREGKALGVGFWNWDDFFLPAELHQPVVDGWHDEGARDWRQVRALRLMMWTGEIDVPKTYELLGELDGRYIAVQDYYPGESPKKFREALQQNPQLFAQVADWGQVTLFERVVQ